MIDQGTILARIFGRKFGRVHHDARMRSQRIRLSRLMNVPAFLRLWSRMRSGENVFEKKKYARVQVFGGSRIIII